MKAVLAEVSGTFLLLAVVVGSGIMGETLSAGNAGLALFVNAVSTGAALYVLITVLGPISGAHFNPLVSIKCLLEKSIGIKTTAVYIVAQIIGAVLGVIFAHLMFDLPLVQTGIKVRAGMGILSAECLASFGLVAVIMLGERLAKDKIASLVGFYITSAYLFTSSTSFANPAVTVARSLTATFAGIAPSSVFGFIAVQFSGLLLAFGICGKLYRDKVRSRS